MEDGQLLHEYAEHGSEAAFSELMDRHLDLVYSTAVRWLGNSQAAEDVAQSVFCLLAKKAQRLEPEKALGGWLYRTTFFIASRHRESEHRRRRREQEAVLMNSADTNTNQGVSWEQVEPILDETMNMLNGQERRALLLRFFEGKPLQEIGHTLGISEDAARMRVNRALERMRGFLFQKGITCSVTVLGIMLGEKAVKAVGLVLKKSRLLLRIAFFSPAKIDFVQPAALKIQFVEWGLRSRPPLLSGQWPVSYQLRATP